MPPRTSNRLATGLSDAEKEESVRALESNLFVVMRRWSSRLERVGGGELPTVHFALLRVLARLGSMPLRDLAESLELDASTVSRHVAALCAQGLVDRRTSNEDRRQSFVSLTADGEAEVRRIRERLVDDLRRVVGEWSDTELQATQIAATHLRNELLRATHIE